MAKPKSPLTVTWKPSKPWAKMTKAEQIEYQAMKDLDKIKFSRRVALSAHNLTKNELRLIYLAVNSLPVNISIGEYAESSGTTVTSADFRATFGLTQAAAVSAMKAAVENLYERTIKFRRFDLAEDWVRWIAERTVYKNGSISMYFNPKLIPDLLRMQEGGYAMLSMDIIGKLSTMPAIALYRLVKTHEWIDYQIVKIEDLHHTLESAPSMVSDFKALKLKVIEPALTEINAKTDMKISYTTTHGAHNKVVAVNFTFGQEVTTINTGKVTSKEANELTAKYRIARAKAKQAEQDAAEKAQEKAEQGWTLVLADEDSIPF